MYLEDHTITDTVNELAAVSCGELFADYGVPIERGQFEWDETNAPLFSSVMGFVGDSLRGTCLLVCERHPLEATCPPGGGVRDWVGEMTNQLVGRLKVKLLAYDINVAMTTPVVLQGVRIQPLPKVPACPVMFSAGTGNVLVWIEVEVAAGFALPPPRRADAGETGELMLF
jgi:hypothetical protein